MSLMRRFSNALSSRRASGRSDDQKPRRQKRVALTDAPVPETRSMTTNDLFSPIQSTSVQSTDMNRQLFEIPQPNKVDAMTDLLKQHEDGNYFPYVGIVGSEGESSDARRARMLALKPAYNKRDVPEIKVLGCPLISREGTFTMDSLMQFAQQNTTPVPVSAGPMPSGDHSKKFSISKPYVHIRQVTILYTPNMSSTSNYCSLHMNLVDNRLIDSDKGSQTNVIVSNQEGIMEMSCDYCVSVNDLSSFSLSYVLERDIVHPNFQWGTASFYFSITESDLPFQSSKVDAVAVYRMPITTLMERTTNADKSDISFTPNDIKRMRELYSQGDIVDVDQPQVARLKTNVYSKSSLRSTPKGQAIDTGNKPGWEFMEGAKKQKVDAYEASEDPDDSSVALPSPDLAEISRSRKEALDRYKKQQAIERAGFIETLSSSPPEASLEEKQVVEEIPDVLDEFFTNTKGKKSVRMDVSGV